MRLPELKKVRPEGLAQLKAQAVSDVMRSMIRPDYIRDLLMNTDLIADGAIAFSRGEIENSMITAIQPDALQQVPMLQVSPAKHGVC